MVGIVVKLSLKGGVSRLKNCGTDWIASAVVDQLKRPDPAPIMNALFECLCNGWAGWIGGDST